MAENPYQSPEESQRKYRARHVIFGTVAAACAIPCAWIATVCFLAMRTGSEFEHYFASVAFAVAGIAAVIGGYAVLKEAASERLALLVALIFVLGSVLASIVTILVGVGE